MKNNKNILLITTDHLRYDTTGIGGDPIIETPAIDSLASAGVSFTRHFSQNPVCAPSRASMITGRYPRHHGVRWNGSSLSENELTLPEFLKERGYLTASIGKHHVSQRSFLDSLDYIDASNIRRQWGERPDGLYEVTERNPFEEYVHSRGYEYKTGYALPDFRARLGAVPSDLPEDCHIDAYVGMRAREFLDNLDGQHPFFLWLGFYGPHHPYVPSGDFAGMYDWRKVPPFRTSATDFKKKPVDYTLYCETEDHKFRGFQNASEETFRKMKAAYYGTVSQIDYQLEQVLSLLDERGIRENTIVVFTSDHGEFLGDHGIPAKAPFLLDCMLHVPLVISAPGMPSGIECNDLTESVDLFPTIADLAGLTIPEAVQGMSLKTFRSDSRECYSPRDAVYAEAVDKKCIRTSDWKYIHYPNTDRGELYDLRNDRFELNNLFFDLPEKTEEMRLALYRLLDSTEDFRSPGYSRFSGIDPKHNQYVTHYHTW